MTVERAEVQSEDRWNVEVLYPSLAEWEEEFKEVGGDPTAVQRGEERWPAIGQYRGRLGESPAVLKEAMELLMSLARKLEKLYT